MLGKRVLYPHGFHVTGLPIKVCHVLMFVLSRNLIIRQASADKLIREIEMFGEDFENYERVHAEMTLQAELEEAVPAQSSDAAAVDKSKGKKGKLAAKSSGHKYQFQILLSIGVPRSEIKKFADPMHWLVYFPPIAIVCLLVALTVQLLNLSCSRKTTTHSAVASTGVEGF